MRDVTPGAPGKAETVLRERIRQAGGSISFEEWMRFALYDAEHGYYSTRVRTVGREGDFSTSATLGSALGHAVAAWAAHHRGDVAARGARWHLIELGGGTGELAAQVLGSLGWWARRGLRYHLIEVSAGLRAAQRERLASWEGRVCWHETLTDALSAAGGAALIFSNEFVDAFPCVRWVFDEDARWREIRVAWPDDALEPSEIRGGVVAAEEQALASVADADFLPNQRPGQHVEVLSSYRRWQGEQLAGWKRGRLLTIDYGEEVRDLYHRRPAGTLRAYCRQMRFTGREIYARLGQQDLTADVNFTDLRHWGEEIGLVTASYGTQADFLRRFLSRSALQRGKSDGRLAYLLDPAGPGAAFKVLEQTRGVGGDARLS